MMKIGWLWLCITVDIGMKISNCWKLFCYGVNNNHYNKLIDIREFLEQLLIDYFNNPFTKDTIKPVKNIPLLYDIDDKGTVSTCHSLNYSSSSPHKFKYQHNIGHHDLYCY